ncbi:histidine phosphatase family protein [Streptomyces sp. NRRL WC-3742]|uniref:histidine phosphatase family protein n=1 Tax=Streptomyces sp. NRRL WC-3742 TaxID=1463934 RepID=UPI0004CBEF9D|nr:histidine phosphatase family protein [Streptomyces sp. NRRL WC-3742]
MSSAARYLYLARHGEALPDESGLSGRGERQAELLGQRLAGRPISAVHHGPLPRAAQTARLVAGHLPAAALAVSEHAGDYVPYVPERAELPADSADFLLEFLSRTTPEEREHGPALAAQAMERFTGPVPGDQERHELLVTHNFLIAWLVRQALDAPRWRWLGLNHANAGLTVLRWAPGRPPAVLLHNDQRHLPADLRWTGFPADHHL